MSARRVMVPFGLGLLTAVAVPVTLMALGATRLRGEEEERVAALPEVAAQTALQPSQVSQRSREEADAEADLIIAGVVAVRRFSVDEHDRLRPLVMQDGFVWEPGVSAAVCIVYGHPTPSPDCSCGLYALSSTRGLPGGDVTGVVELTGLVETGPKGYRAERGRVVALAPRRVLDSVLPTLFALAVTLALAAVVGMPVFVIAVYGVVVLALIAVVAAEVRWRRRRQFARVQRLYPEAICYPSEAAMLRAHPLTELPAEMAQSAHE